MEKGKFYLVGDFYHHPIYNSWTWTLGDHIIDQWQGAGAQLPIDYDRLLITSFRDYESVISCTLTNDDCDVWDFAVEVRENGAKHEVSRKEAINFAELLPMPIVYTHESVPFCTADLVNDLKQWAAEYNNESLFDCGVLGSGDERSVYNNKRWGLNRGNYVGGDHWLLPVLNAFSLTDASIMLNVDVDIREATVGASWITNAIYVPNDDDPIGLLQELHAKGVDICKL